MRIGFDAKRAFNNYSGLGNYSRNLIRQLTKFYPDHDYFLYSPLKKTNIQDFPPLQTYIRSPKNKIHVIFPFIWRSWRLPEIMGKDQIEIYHGLSNELPFDMEKFKGKSIVSIHDLIFLRYPGQYRYTDRSIYKLKVRSGLKAASRIIAISEQTKRDIVYYFGTDPEKIEVIYQDCSPAFYLQEADEEKNIYIRQKYNLPGTYFLYVGTVEERKNLLSIIKAIHSHKIDLPLVVIGKPTYYKKKVLQYIIRNRIPNIIFKENVLQDDLPGLYRNASFFVYPSSYEGFGIPVLEALNSEIPVIAARGSCLEETGGNAAIYVDPLNIDELGNAIRNIMDDSLLRASMVEKGKKHALKFRPEVTTRKLFELYKKLHSQTGTDHYG